MNREIKCYTTKRSGRLALWLKYGEEERNVWDIDEKEFTGAVEQAIVNACRIGLEFARGHTAKALNSLPSIPWGGNQFERKNVEDKW